MSTPDKPTNAQQSSDNKELHTEGPISEKDEVKKAENNTQQGQADEASVAADLKNKKSEPHKE